MTAPLKVEVGEATVADDWIALRRFKDACNLELSRRVAAKAQTVLSWQRFARRDIGDMPGLSKLINAHHDPEVELAREIASFADAIVEVCERLPDAQRRILDADFERGLKDDVAYKIFKLKTPSGEKKE